MLFRSYCPDQPGLVHAVTHFIFEHRGNILDLEQHIDHEDDVFFMRVEWSLEKFDIAKADIAAHLARIAESRLEIEQARLLTLKAAWLMDTVGLRGAQTEISAIKVVAARTATNVIDRAIQVFGGAGVSGDWPLADMYAHARTLHLVDGPDDVHLMQIARRELGRFAHLRPDAG